MRNLVGRQNGQGKISDEEYGQCCGLNEDMFLQKPIDLKDLIRKINLGTLK
jgi:hypothetical protein